MATLGINYWLPAGDSNTASCHDNITREIMTGKPIENEEPRKADHAKRRLLRLLS
jgi:hypothetical protein